MVVPWRLGDLRDHWSCEYRFGNTDTENRPEIGALVRFSTEHRRWRKNRCRAFRVVSQGEFTAEKAAVTDVMKERFAAPA